MSRMCVTSCRVTTNPNPSPEFDPWIDAQKIVLTLALTLQVYDKKAFIDDGIKHYDLYFVDGGTPSEAIVRRFCEICETEPGCISVHCKVSVRARTRVRARARVRV